MTDERIYALYADSQDDLERLIGLRGILTGAPGIGGLKSLEPPLQAQGDFKLYGELEADAFGKRRSGESMAEALEFVKAAPNRVLGIGTLEQIADYVHDSLCTSKRSIRLAAELQSNTPLETLSVTSASQASTTVGSGLAERSVASLDSLRSPTT